MSVHGRIVPPEGHGEVLCDPPYPTWSAILEGNRDAAAAWPEPLRALRSAARTELVSLASAWSGGMGISEAAVAGDAPIVMTGHQPELYHPGVWVKVFLLDRLARETGATGIDLVVDTDRAEETGVRLPHLGPPVAAESVVLAPATPGAYVQAPVPDGAERARFRAQGAAVLSSLPAPALGHHFEAFCDALDAAAVRSSDLGGLMTAARRAFEAPAEAAYLEAPVSRIAGTATYLAWAASLLADAAGFRDSMNEALRSYRARTGTRSAAQPFPDLEQRGDLIEAPFWVLHEGMRERVWVHADGSLCAGEEAAVLAPETFAAALVALSTTGSILAPKAITLTMFARLFCSDFFIHGTGGGRYDRVTDSVIADYYGIEPPRYAVASMTLLLPLGAHVATADEVSLLTQELNRLEHNPDAVLDEVEFDDESEHRRAHELAEQKAALVQAIKDPDADKKAIGAKIREVNTALGEMLEPVVIEVRERLERARAAQQAADVLTDRTYPYCLWDPREVSDKVR
ncbi:MAG: hypothetical protein JXP37_07330 [Coriobacteriia bacterium]|nr:hypothetical protein [Coriobacteriia bacterium]